MTLSQLSGDIPVGDIQFYDNYVPALDAGTWRIEVEQTINEGGKSITGDDTLGSKQYFVVSAPQVHIEPKVIVNQYPPAGSIGKYGEVLPHVVLSDPMLPWERKMEGSSERQPWLALLVFSPDEIIGATVSDTRLTSTTVENFLAAETGVLKPAVIIEDDIDKQSQVCNFIKISVQTFQKITPRLEELRYLTHCRQINTGDKAILAINEHGLFSVVVANRFPKRPATRTDSPAESIVHLVSLEGFEAYLTDAPAFGSNTSVNMLTLASWNFQTQPDNAQDFRGLVNNIVSSESTYPSTGPIYCPDNLWLRSPLPAVAGEVEALDETYKRIINGFVPLTYHTRVGAETFSWYRGPLTPLFTTNLGRTEPFLTSDAALIYDRKWGVFDTSLATAWQIGRATALSDKLFGKLILDFRRQTHRIADNLLHRLQSDHFSANEIAAVVHDSRVEDEFTQLLNEQLLADIGQGATTKATIPPVDTSTPPNDPKQDIEDFLNDPAVQTVLKQLVAADLDPIAKWLARLLLLYPVPFNYLVADPEMLPVESLRFFYLDENWISALLDGALTIGIESSRDTFCHQITHGLLHDAARTAAKFARQQLAGIESRPTEVDDGLVAGFVLRSALVSGWPNLAVRPCKGSNLLKILRMDRLSKNVLFCLFAGVPDYVEFSEPQEALRFGVDDEGNLPLRTLTANDPHLGFCLKGDPMIKVYDLTGMALEYMRAAGSRVLNIAPDSKTGLIQGLQTANNTAPNPLGPGALALQMVKSPEAIKFHSVAGSQS